MGMIGRILGAGTAAREIGAAVGGVAEVLAGNRAAREAAEAAGFAATVGQYGAEFASAGNGQFDRFVNGLNRLPRPLLALGTLALFVYAMVEPVGFGERMQGLNLVPEPLWWLLGAIVSFYFGARELHHQRTRTTLSTLPAPAAAEGSHGAPLAALSATRTEKVDADHNAAVEEWRRLRR
jgi:hypothetical protein